MMTDEETEEIRHLLFELGVKLRVLEDWINEEDGKEQFTQMLKEYLYLEYKLGQYLILQDERIKQIK